jgi:alpha-glucosidase
MVTSVPDSFKFPDFYKKFIKADGIPIISSGRVDDLALLKARSIVAKMLAKIPEVNKVLIRNNEHILIVGHNEEMSDIPEYKGFDKLVDEKGTILNNRVRGMGPTLKAPYCSCGEENLLCLNSDRYKGQSVLVHEFAHAIAIIGISYVDTSFRNCLTTIFLSAKKKGLWRNTYAMANVDEYFAVGVQCWFNVYKKVIPADGVYNEISNRKELLFYDPQLYKMLNKYFFEDNSIECCK